MIFPIIFASICNCLDHWEILQNRVDLASENYEEYGFLQIFLNEDFPVKRLNAPALLFTHKTVHTEKLRCKNKFRRFV